MRVGLVSAEFPPQVGGVGDHTARLAQELSEAGHQVEVLTDEGPSSEPPPRVTVLRAVRAWDFRIWRQLPVIARQREWDVLHIQYQPAAYKLHGAINVLPWLVRGRRPAVVTTFHDLRYPYLFPKAGRLRTAAVGALAKGSDAVIAVSDDDLAQLQAWRRSRPEQTTRHVPLGDQIDAPLPDGYVSTEWRARLGLSPETPVVAHVGLINSSKGVLDLVRAIADLPSVHLLMIGESVGASDATNRTYLETVRLDVERLGLIGRVHWTGYVSASELLAWLGTADVVALPFTDGASLRRTSLITAWRHHGAVVTSVPRDTPGWYASSPGNRAALYVTPHDHRAIASALTRGLSSAVLRSELGLMASLFAERFSWPSVVRQTLSVYNAALSARRA